MEENEGTEICPNCKRDIPARNYTIHSLHCVRNIKICNVCKEPIPHDELEAHNEKLHLLVPCKQCGEMARGTDMEDHVRDSCAFTMKPCRFCSMELRRREVPSHERYCGARTERCADCGEFVMLRYRQLHLDSNHGFLRLDDDPVPRPGVRPIGSRPINGLTSPRPVIPMLATPTEMMVEANWVRFRNRAMTLKRTNDQPQINMDSEPEDKLVGLNKKMETRGPVGGKKRLAPKPPTDANGAAGKPATAPAPSRAAARPPSPAPAPDPRRDLAYFSALQRRQDEERRRQEQNTYNLSVGLPPVLDPAAKLEKLRKMDALHNRADEVEDYRHRLRGRVWQGDDCGAAAGHVLGHADSASATNAVATSAVTAVKEGAGPARTVAVTASANSAAVNNASAASPAAEAAGADFADLAISETLEMAPEDEPQLPSRGRLADITPMTVEEFQMRFNELRLLRDHGAVPRADIRASLQELRRGLNEVIAPYNNNNNNNAANAINNNASVNNYNVRAKSPNARPLDNAANACDNAGASNNAGPYFNDEYRKNAAKNYMNVSRNNSISNRNRGVDNNGRRVAGVVAGAVAAMRTDDDDDFEYYDEARAPTPPRGSPEGDVKVPCEFCGQAMRADQLNGHETYCGFNMLVAGAAPPAAPQDDDIPVIPCEFCAVTLPVYLITEHQELCRREGQLLYPD